MWVGLQGGLLGSGWEHAASPHRAGARLRREELQDLGLLCIESFYVIVSFIVFMRHGMEKIWGPNQVFSLQSLCCWVSSPAPPWGI